MQDRHFGGTFTKEEEETAQRVQNRYKRRPLKHEREFYQDTEDSRFRSCKRYGQGKVSTKDKDKVIEVKVNVKEFIQKLKRTEENYL